MKVSTIRTMPVKPATRLKQGGLPADGTVSIFENPLFMATSDSHVNCKFCDLNQVAAQPYCAGCGAPLPLMASEMKTNKKLLDMSAQMNTLLVRENARIRKDSKQNRTRIALGIAGLGCLIWLGSIGIWGSGTSVITEAEMMRDNRVNQRYTRALEMQLYSDGQLSPEQRQDFAIYE